MNNLLLCKKCNEDKELSNFYPSTTFKNHGECKSCVRMRVNKSHKATHRIEFHASKKGKRAAIDKFQRYLVNNKDRHKVRLITNRAINAGLLVRDSCCSECGGADKKIEAHHDNYNEPLIVRWLCKSCHWDWHNNNIPIYN